MVSRDYILHFISETMAKYAPDFLDESECSNKNSWKKRRDFLILGETLN